MLQEYLQMPSLRITQNLQKHVYKSGRDFSEFCGISHGISKIQPFFRSFSKVSNDVHLDCSYLFARAGFLLIASLRCESRRLRIPWIDFNRIKTSTQCLMNLCWWIFSASTFMWHASIPERHVLARRRSKTLQCSRHLGPWKCHIAGQRQRERDWETFRCPFRTLKQIETSNRLEHI